ncbi:MAG: PIN domain-containing protein [Bryobacteraceae bacterium]
MAPSAILDACVLVNFSLCDTLLRMAEPPELYEPRWSEEIMAETVRNLESKLKWPPSLTTYFESQVRAHFADAWVTGYEPLIPRMTNDPKDRHVMAAAVQCSAPIIVTLNLRHFRPEHLNPWGIVALDPDTFLIDLYRQESEIVRAKLAEQAADRRRRLPELLQILKPALPNFVALIS